jgi:hypothetical protein
MTTREEALFTDLNALTEEQIEAGLAEGYGGSRPGRSWSSILSRLG